MLPTKNTMRLYYIYYWQSHGKCVSLYSQSACKLLDFLRTTSITQGTRLGISVMHTSTFYQCCMRSNEPFQISEWESMKKNALRVFPLLCSTHSLAYHWNIVLMRFVSCSSQSVVAEQAKQVVTESVWHSKNSHRGSLVFHGAGGCCTYF